MVRLPVQVELLEQLASGVLLHVLVLFDVNNVLLQLGVLEVLAGLLERLLQLLELLGAATRLVWMLLQGGPSEHLDHVLHLGTF